MLINSLLCIELNPKNQQMSSVVVIDTTIPGMRYVHL